jgi:hypothetical protein
MTIAALPQPLPYAAPSGPTKRLLAVGIVSLVVAILTGPLIVLALYRSGTFAALLAAVRSAEWVTPETLCGLGLIGMLLGQVTLARAGIDAIRGRASTVKAHRVYVRMQVYGALAVFLSIVWGCAAFFHHAGLPTMIVVPLMLRPAMLLLAALVYPAVVLRVPALRPGRVTLK